MTVTGPVTPTSARRQRATPTSTHVAAPDDVPVVVSMPHDPGSWEAVPVNTVDETAPCELTVLIPTRNEADNVAMLLGQLSAYPDAPRTEVVFVDDSDDATPRAVITEAAHCRMAVRLLHRPAGDRAGGLSGAVVAGIRAARGEWVLVMDGDLQHPPEVALSLARTAMRHDVDLVAGTRYAGGGSGDGLDGAGRALTSTAATRVTKALFPRRLSALSDPMSGLFAFRRSAVDVQRLRPAGFKILLEIVARHPGLRIAEVAFAFQPRFAGESKASMHEGLVFLRQLSRLRRDVLRKQLAEGPASRAERLQQLLRGVGFGLVGLSGIAVNTGALWLLLQLLGVHYLLAAAIATQASTGWNFLLIDGLVYRRPKRGTAPGRAARFFFMNNALLLLRLPTLALLTAAGLHVLAANVVSLVVLFLLRFLVSDRVIYGSTDAAVGGEPDPVRLLVDSRTPALTAASRKRRSQYLTHRYDVAGVVTIGSQIPLPELEFFRAGWVSDTDVDIALRVGDVGRRSPRSRASMTEYTNPPAVRYEEHLGRLGANFRVDFGEPTSVTVGPLLAHSPHVVYTNIVEALLRFMMVSRGRMLLHSACLALDGRGVMLSARTDTGKTATVLRLLRERSAQFLSDDMTVIDAEGHAYCFPKPLTISAHTVRAVQAKDLTPAEWRRLQLQSRLHSKGGRGVGLALSRLNLPIMGLNAVTQMVIPPPKYRVDRLVPCRIASDVQIEDLFIIERGTPRLAELDHAETLQRMLENTDDAYGFPPFRHLAPALVIGERDYRTLRAEEQEILSSALRHIRSRVLASDCFGWADEIPRLAAPQPIVLPRPADHTHRRAFPRWNSPVLTGESVS